MYNKMKPSEVQLDKTEIRFIEGTVPIATINAQVHVTVVNTI